jgi:hypothetical protein
MVRIALRIVNLLLPSESSEGLANSIPLREGFYSAENVKMA